MTHFVICLYSWVIREIIFARAQNNEVHGIGRHDEVPEGLGTLAAVAKQICYSQCEGPTGTGRRRLHSQSPWQSCRRTGRKNWEAPAMDAELLAELQMSYRNWEALAAITGTLAELQRH